MITDRTRQATLISLFRRTAHLMVAELVDRLATAGYPDLPAATHPVFENLDRDGTRLTDLAARADMTHQSMGELIDTLEHRGYVERLPTPATDGPAWCASPPRAGKWCAPRCARSARSKPAGHRPGQQPAFEAISEPPSSRPSGRPRHHRHHPRGHARLPRVRHTTRHHRRRNPAGR